MTAAELIASGLTPAKLEHIINQPGWHKRCWAMGFSAREFRDLCKRWGIEAPAIKRPGPPPRPRLSIEESNRIIDRAYAMFGGCRDVCLILGTCRERLYEWRRRGLNVDTANRWRAEWPGLFE